MAYTTIDNPELYFQTKIYTGNAGDGSGTTQSVTFDSSEDMQPDFVWLKERAGGADHRVFDSVRGTQKVLRTNATSAEGSGDALTAFNSNGFTLNDSQNANENGMTMVSWNWKAGGSASSNSNGSITSSVSANTTAGFSIVAYTGNETAGATVGHGLGAVPQTYWVKSRSVGDGWRVYHDKVSSDPETDYLVLNNTNAVADSHGYWNDTAPTSNVFSLGAAGEVNTNGSTNIAYCFTEIKGFSKFGKYTGNGNADGTFVYTGFKPALVIRKRSSGTESWQVHDNKRDTFNVVYHRLLAEDSGSEYTSASNQLDFLSNGFKMRATQDGGNASGSTYIYMAFAESPFVNSNGVPNNAR